MMEAKAFEGGGGFTSLDSLKVRRILLKLSGEALSAGSGDPWHAETLNRVAEEMVALSDGGNIQIAVVVGGGNFLRGATLPFPDRVLCDQMGMLATVMNAMALGKAIKIAGGRSTVLSSVGIPGVVEKFSRDRAVHAMEDGEIVVFGGGTGSPFFTTDTASALRAAEIEADLILKATKVDGIYDSDPEINPEAKRFESISYGEILERKLGFMDSTAISFCMDNSIPILVFDMTASGNLENILKQKNRGSLVTP